MCVGRRKDAAVIIVAVRVGADDDCGDGAGKTGSDHMLHPNTRKMLASAEIGPKIPPIGPCSPVSLRFQWAPGGYCWVILHLDLYHERSD